MHLTSSSAARVVALALLGASGLAGAASALTHQPALDDLLPAAQAFDLMPVEFRDGALRLSWNIAPGYYLYRQRIRVEVLAPSPLAVQAIRLPAGIAHVDEHFGAVQIYRGLLEAQVPTQGALKQALRLRVTFQGCADAGVCYPPQTITQTIVP